MKTLVLALGNPLRGDDGLGAAVLDWLHDCDLPPDVTLLDGGTPGLELVLTLAEYEHAVIVDAAEMGLPPGSWRRFTADAIRMQSGNLGLRGTLHYAGLAEALALGAAMDMLPPDVVIFGVQPATIGWMPGLSEVVKAAIPAVSAAVSAAVVDVLTQSPDEGNYG